MTSTNNQDSTYKAYKKDFEYSYTLGAFPTMELISTRPKNVKTVIIHSKYDGSTDFEQICHNNSIEVIHNDKMINRISSKENCFVIGVFTKFENLLSENTNHVVLVNPSDMGNLGTIIRTLIGFGIKDLAIIRPCADVFNPKVIRASMGAVFKIRFAMYDNFLEYSKAYGKRDMFPFMLDGRKTLSIQDCPQSDRFSLIFGNEAAGLDASYQNVGTSIFIPQTKDVDSLNLPISVGIGSFIFTSKNY